MILKCNNCKREWEYKGNSKYYATCTQCLRKVNIKKKEVQKDEELHRDCETQSTQEETRTIMDSCPGEDQSENV